MCGPDNPDSYLEKEKVHYIDYSTWNLNLLSPFANEITFDGHPTAIANKILAESL